MASILPINQSSQNISQPVGNAGQVQVHATDPLFNALANYLTTGPDAQNITANDIQKLINSHASQPGGRAYLEQLVAVPSSVPQFGVFALQALAAGGIVVNPRTFTLSYNLNGQLSAYRFVGTIQGAFGRLNQTFADAMFSYNNAVDIVAATAVFVAKMVGNKLYVTFTNSETKAECALEIVNVAMNLPSEGISGIGQFYAAV